jgi:hypothetical protein
MNLIKGSKEKEKMESRIDIKIIKKCKKKSHNTKIQKELQIVTHLLQFPIYKINKKKPTMLKQHV